MGSVVPTTARADVVIDVAKFLLSGRPPESFWASDFPGEQNSGLYGCHLYFASFLQNTYYSLSAPTPQDLVFTLAAYAADLGLKHCKPQIIAPEDLILEKSPDNQCMSGAVQI